MNRIFSVNHAFAKKKPSMFDVEGFNSAARG